MEYKKTNNALKDIKLTITSMGDARDGVTNEHMGCMFLFSTDDNINGEIVKRWFDTYPEDADEVSTQLAEEKSGIMTGIFMTAEGMLLLQIVLISDGILKKFWDLPVSLEEAVNLACCAVECLSEVDEDRVPIKAFAETARIVKDRLIEEAGKK